MAERKIYRVLSDNRSPIRTDTQAQQVGEFLEKRFGDDPITPEQYIAAAKPARSPTHWTLEWNDAKAAHQHRINQARQVLRSIVVVTNDEQRVQPRAYHSVALITNEGAHRAYMPQHVVWAREELAEQVVAEALTMLRSWKSKYAGYKDRLTVLRLAAPHVEEAVKLLEASDSEA